MPHHPGCARRSACPWPPAIAALPAARILSPCTSPRSLRAHHTPKKRKARNNRYRGDSNAISAAAEAVMIGSPSSRAGRGPPRLPLGRANLPPDLLAGNPGQDHHCGHAQGEPQSARPRSTTDTMNLFGALRTSMANHRLHNLKQFRRRDDVPRRLMTMQVAAARAQAVRMGAGR